MPAYSHLRVALAHFERDYQLLIIGMLDDKEFIKFDEEQKKREISLQQQYSRIKPKEWPTCKSLQMHLDEIPEMKRRAEDANDRARVDKLSDKEDCLRDSTDALHEISQRMISKVNKYAGAESYPMLLELHSEFTDDDSTKEISLEDFAPGPYLRKILEALLKNPLSPNYHPMVKKIIYHYLVDALLPTLAEYINCKKKPQVWWERVRNLLGFKVEDDDLQKFYELQKFCNQVRNRLRPTMEAVNPAELITDLRLIPARSPRLVPSSSRMPKNADVGRTLAISLQSSSNVNLSQAGRPLSRAASPNGAISPSAMALVRGNTRALRVISPRAGTRAWTGGSPMNGGATTPRHGLGPQHTRKVDPKLSSASSLQVYNAARIGLHTVASQRPQAGMAASAVVAGI